MKTVTQSHSSIAEGSGANGHTIARNGNGADAASRTSRSLVRRPARPGAEAVKPGAHQWREFLPVAAGRSEAAAGLPAQAVSENEILLFFCIKGRGWCEIEGQRHEMMPGQLLIIPAKLGRTYATYGERSWSLIWIQLVETLGDALGAKLNAGAHTTTLEPGERAQMLVFFQDVLHALEMPCQQRLQQVSQRAVHLLNGVISKHGEGCASETNAAGKIGRTIEYMKEHMNEPLRAATLAGIANMSLPHYFAQFKRVIGSSPIDYLIKLRMDHARRLLSETSWSVKEVAVSLGYEDPLYFSRVFKSINQRAPTDFRARKRNSDGG
jgi:AraC-like DNA-binding protein